MKEIKLGQQGKNKGLYVAMVDDEDFEWLNNFKWCAVKGGNTFYAVRSIYEKDDTKKLRHKSERMHCVIMKGKMIDHIDHNGLNCQKTNMRQCTNQQNLMNRKPNKKSTSIYKGVSISRITDKSYVANIKINGVLSYIGRFKIEIEAAKAYDNAAKKLFGEYAYLNFPEHV